MPTVYLIAMPTVRGDGSMPVLEPLAEFGRVKVLVPAGDSPTRKPTRVIESIADRLHGFNPDEDYLVWAGGDTLAAVMVGYLLCERVWDRIQWLRFDRDRAPDGTRLKTGRYYPTVVEFGSDPQVELEFTSATPPTPDHTDHHEESDDDVD